MMKDFSLYISFNKDDLILLFKISEHASEVTEKINIVNRNKFFIPKNYTTGEIAYTEDINIETNTTNSNISTNFLLII